MEAVAVVVPVGALEQAQDQDRGQTQDQANITAQARFMPQAQMQDQMQAQDRVTVQDQVEAMGLETARVTTELARLMAQVTDPGSLPIRIRNYC